MSSLSFLYFYLIGVSLIPLLTAVSEVEYYDYTPAPDYDYENTTFEYSFFSNSTEDLEKLLKGNEEFTSTENPKDVEEVTVTTATTRGGTERVSVHSAASLPVHLDFRTLVWTLMILISLNVQQLQHTL